MASAGTEGRLSEDALQRLQQRFRARAYDDGSVIHYYGDPAPTMGVVLEGAVAFSRTSEKGEKTNAGQLTRGEVYGVFAVLTNRARTQDALAVGKTRIISLSRKNFRQLLSTDPDFQEAVLLFHARRLEHTVARIQDNVHMTLKGRLCVLLLHLCRDECGIINATQSELAQQLSVSRNSIGACLNYLANQKLVAIGYRRLEIPSRERLSAWLRSHG